jgi:hypothetical protein
VERPSLYPRHAAGDRHQPGPAPGTLAGPDGRTLVATSQQPLFHVEHAVGGAEQGPLNLWRIVHLTDAPDEQLTALFSRIWASPWLPEFVEIYIQRNLHIGLHRR